MPEFEAFLTDHVPEVSFVSAHGRLGSRELERRTNAFYDGEYDVLLSTTIIAAGLDIPTANTIVIARAERFGLAQLHQIRGRVGRSRTRAYAYITYMPGTRLGERALQRLEVLRDNRFPRIRFCVGRTGSGHPRSRKPAGSGTIRPRPGGWL